MVFLVLAACGGASRGSDSGPSDSGASDVGPTDAVGGAADRLFLGGQVYTGTASGWAEAVAVRDGVIVAVGSDEEVRPFQGPGTELVDLAGRMLMPGFIDAHIHVLEGSHEASGTCLLRTGRDPERMISELRACAPGQVGTDWVLGYGHDIESLLATTRPPREILDEAIPDRPAVMMEQTSHSVWANSRALAAAGIDSTTADPPGGLILRDAVTGEPNGILLESAGDMLFELALAPSAALDTMNDEAIAFGLQEANRNGITALAEGRTYWRRGYVQAWQRAEAAGTLTARITLGLWAHPARDDAMQLSELVSRFRREPGAMVQVGQVKLYSDGLIGNTTAALLEPYLVETWGDPRGLNYFDAARLTTYVTELEAAGFDMHVHAIGDRAVRETLDAIEAARETHGDIGARHRLTHLELVHPEDLPRFAALDVTADLQMSSEFADEAAQFSEEELLGRSRLETEHLPLRDLSEAGARVILSSDWDVGDMSPLVGIERALTRGDQVLPSLEDAIAAYTVRAAYVLRREDEIGSVEVGKAADFVVLDRNLFEIAVSNISETQVRMTVVAGNTVYSR